MPDLLLEGTEKQCRMHHYEVMDIQDERSTNVIMDSVRVPTPQWNI